MQAAIYANLSKQTVLLIAHRLSTVEKADRIVVIRQGKVAGDVARDKTSPDEIVRMITGEAFQGKAQEARPNGPTA